MPRRFLFSISLIGAASIVAAVAFYSMRSKGGSSGPTASEMQGGDTGHEASSDHIGRVSDAWTLEEVKDPLTDQVTNDLIRRIALDAGVTGTLHADCRQLKFFITKVTFLSVRVVFSDANGNAVDIDNTGFNEHNIGSVRTSNVVGQEGSVDAVLLHTNEIQLRLATSVNLFGGTKSDPFGFAASQFFKVAIPLRTGDNAVFDLLPQDANINAAFKDCQKQELADRDQQSSNGNKAALDPKDTQPLPPCVYGTEMVAKENAVIINVDGSTAPLDKSTQGKYFMPQPHQDSHNPDQCIVKSEHDDEEYVIPRVFLKESQ